MGKVYVFCTGITVANTSFPKNSIGTGMVALDLVVTVTKGQTPGAGLPPKSV